MKVYSNLELWELLSRDVIWGNAQGRHFNFFLGGAKKFFYFLMPPDYWKSGKNNASYVVIWRYLWFPSFFFLFFSLFSFFSFFFSFFLFPWRLWECPPDFLKSNMYVSVYWWNTVQNTAFIIRHYMSLGLQKNQKIRVCKYVCQCIDEILHLLFVTRSLGQLAPLEKSWPLLKKLKWRPCY